MNKRSFEELVAAFEDPLTGRRTLIAPEPLPRVQIDNDFYWENVLVAMHDVMQSETGTARATGLGAPYQMAGKSGTAQVISIAQDEKSAVVYGMPRAAVQLGAASHEVSIEDIRDYLIRCCDRIKKGKN